ncbi:hypothetical protein [Absidia glauca]|uniref:RPA-interacting protein C-terminal domain-containing protein n=1 Tax=Absidia glauca TaxID=4829 RepID=A0A168RFX0_ABSGL|nr:hypothetical protein [Absidia glauca]
MDGLECSECEATIPLACQNGLTPQGLKTMIHSAKEHHRLCQGGSSKVASSTLGLPDGDDIFLVWTCGGCGQLEILV